MDYLPLILGMTIVTYLPRLLPLLFLTKRDLNPKLDRFLQYIPYTSLSILIVRGVLTSSIDMLLPSLLGITIAGLISYFKSNLILSVVASILVSFIAINVFL